MIRKSVTILFIFLVDLFLWWYPIDIGKDVNPNKGYTIFYKTNCWNYVISMFDFSLPGDGGGYRGPFIAVLKQNSGNIVTASFHRTYFPVREARWRDDSVSWYCSGDGVQSFDLVKEDE